MKTLRLFDYCIHGLRCLLVNQLENIDESEDEHRSAHGDRIATLLFASRKMLVEHSDETFMQLWLDYCEGFETVLERDRTAINGMKYQRRMMRRAATSIQSSVDKMFAEVATKSESASKTIRRTDNVDPNANLAEQLRLARELLNIGTTSGSPLEMANRLAELVVGMNQWLVNKGFKPKSWHSEDNPRLRQLTEALYSHLQHQVADGAIIQNWEQTDDWAKTVLGIKKR